MIRLKLRSQPPSCVHQRGKRITLDVPPGGPVQWRNVCSRGAVRVNLSGVWPVGLHEPLWLMSERTPESALHLYFARLKIAETCRDLKRLVQRHPLMNKAQPQLEKMIALVLLAFSIG